MRVAYRCWCLSNRITCACILLITPAPEIPQATDTDRVSGLRRVLVSASAMGQYEAQQMLCAAQVRCSAVTTYLGATAARMSHRIFVVLGVPVTPPFLLLLAAIHSVNLHPGLQAECNRIVC